MKRIRGFTLIELMVSVAILGVVVMYLTQVFLMQQKTYIVVDQVTEAQQNLRAVADLVERDVRRAGYMVPPHAAVCGYDATTGPDTLFVSNTDKIRSTFDLEANGIALSGNMGALVTGTTSTWSATGSSVTLPLAQDFLDLAADGPDFAIGEGVIVVNRADEDGPIACGFVTDVDPNQIEVNLGATTIGPIGLNAEVVAIPAHAYALTPASGGTPSQFRRNGVLLANDVEDFQVTYFFDLDDDRVVDAGESFGSSGGTNSPFTQAATSFPDPTLLREVQVNLVTVTRDDDPNQDFVTGAGQATANRTGASLPSGDGKRRRVNAARVRLRNAG